MVNKKHQDLIKELEKLDLQGVKFKQAKEQLLAKGYTEAEITHAVYSAPHDGKANKPKPEHEHTKLFRKHPKQAASIARTILKDQEKNRESAERSAFATNAIASRFAIGHHASARYAYRAGAAIGFPVYTALFLSVGWLILVLYMNWPESYLYPGIIIIHILLFLKSKYL